MRSLALLAVTVALGCSTTSAIRTNPPGAKVYLKGEYLGESPVSAKLKDGFVGADYHVRITKDGYEPQEFKLEQHLSAGLITLDAITCLPTLGIMCYVIALNGQRHEDEYVVPLAPLAPPSVGARAPASAKAPPQPGSL